MLINKPEELSGISITSDSTGKDDILSFEFSGIPASVPKSTASDLSLMFSLFSNDIPSRISSLENSSFRDSKVLSESGVPLCEVFFTQNGINYSIIYDRQSGIVHSLNAGNDEISVCVTLTDFALVGQE